MGLGGKRPTLRNALPLNRERYAIRCGGRESGGGGGQEIVIFELRNIYMSL